MHNTKPFCIPRRSDSRAGLTPKNMWMARSWPKPFNSALVSQRGGRLPQTL